MRIAVASLVVGLSAATLAGTPASAAKYCMQGPDSGYPGDCSFATYKQCMATASGTNDGCGINPRYAYKQQRSNSRYRSYGSQ